MAEYWDVYDKDRNPVGRTHRRGVKIKHGDYHIICEAWLLCKGKLLVTQRHPDKNYGCMWECTGGAVKAGETSIEGIIREVREEIGLIISESDLTYRGCATGNNFFIDCYQLSADIEPEKLKLQKEEVINAKFVTLDEFKKMHRQRKLIPNLYEYMERFGFEFLFSEEEGIHQ